MLALAGASDVRPGTQIRKRALRVDGDLLVLDAIDELEFVWLIGKVFSGLVLGHRGVDELRIALDDFAHFCRNDVQICLRQGAGQVEVVIKSVRNGRPDGKFYIRKERGHGLSHDMAAGMPHAGEFVPARVFCHFDFFLMSTMFTHKMRPHV